VEQSGGAFEITTPRQKRHMRSCVVCFAVAMVSWPLAAAVFAGAVLIAAESEVHTQYGQDDGIISSSAGGDATSRDSTCECSTYEKLFVEVRASHTPFVNSDVNVNNALC
jgi:hypothetical protein